MMHLLTIDKYNFLYNKLNYARILTGSHLWSIRGQTHRLRQITSNHYFRVCPSGERTRFRVISKDFKINKFFSIFRFFNIKKQIDSMLPCVCSVIDHRRRQNVGRTSPRVPLFCSYHILTSSVIYHWTDARQHGIYLLKRFSFWSKLTNLSCVSARWSSISLLALFSLKGCNAAHQNNEHV